MTEYVPTMEDKDLWDAANDILEMLNIEDLNPPGLTEQIADYFRDRFPLLSREGVAEHDAGVRVDQAEKDAIAYNDLATRAVEIESLLEMKLEQALNMKLSLDLEDGGWYGGVSVRDVINRAERAEQALTTARAERAEKDAQIAEAFSYHYGPGHVIADRIRRAVALTPTTEETEQ